MDCRHVPRSIGGRRWCRHTGNTNQCTDSRHVFRFVISEVNSCIRRVNIMGVDVGIDVDGWFY
jgi:hypothetical protein